MNIPTWERLLRILLGLALFGAVFIYQSPVRWLGLLGLVPIYTGLIGWCPVRARLFRNRRRYMVYRR